jgi:uncharacterized membrane protein
MDEECGLGRILFLNVVVKRDRRMRIFTCFQDNKNEVIFGLEFFLVMKTNITILEPYLKSSSLFTNYVILRKFLKYSFYQQNVKGITRPVMELDII